MTHISMEDIGRRIRKIRKSRGMTQSELADRIGVDRKQISKLENGRCLMQFDNMIALADATGVSLDYIVGGANDDVQPDIVLTSLPARTRQQILQGLSIIIKAIK